MSFPVSSILHWALDTVRTQVQQAALSAIKSGAVQLTGAIAKGAPEVAQKSIELINAGVDHAVAGIMTQRVKE